MPSIPPFAEEIACWRGSASQPTRRTRMKWRLNPLRLDVERIGMSASGGKETPTQVSQRVLGEVESLVGLGEQRGHVRVEGGRCAQPEARRDPQSLGCREGSPGQRPSHEASPPWRERPEGRSPSEQRTPPRRGGRSSCCGRLPLVRLRDSASAPLVPYSLAVGVVNALGVVHVRHRHGERPTANRGVVESALGCLERRAPSHALVR